MKLLFGATTVALATLASASQASPFFFGGYITPEWDQQTSYSGPVSNTDTRWNLRSEMLVGVKIDKFTFGLGVFFAESDVESDDFEWDADDHGLAILAYDKAVVTYGDIYGAGSIVGDDYFNMHDATSKEDKTVRLDWDTSWGHLAASWQTEEDSSDDPYEIGLVIDDVFGHFLRVAYEGDSRDLAAVAGAKVGDWGYHLAWSQGFDQPSEQTQYGATLLYDFTDRFTVAGNYAITADFKTYGYSLQAWYELSDKGIDGPTLRVELNQRNKQEFLNEFNNLEVSLRIPFGAKLPAGYERLANKEEVKAFGFFNR